MKNMIIFSTLILLFQVALYNCNAEKCDLKGKWKNELGSNMTISVIDKNGYFSGSYLTAVTTQKKVEIKKSPISGVMVPSSQPIFAFHVNWTFSDSITAFTGQCFVDSSGERLETMWLLKAIAGSSDDNWASTRVGSNVFRRLI
ncbi:avidin-like isoform X1 [Acipenser ruthenus]|uniref:avidin-like isoform X1 n=2 Tax=Acipenser ruthenus TaxID=7906 RepID=UPI002741441E|nr:avidin-like isoform X1 [Acipenser ruthenus]